MNKNACQGPFTTADQSAEQRCARFSLFLTSTSFLLFLACFGGTSSAAAQQANPAAGAGSIIVHGKFGGIIFGFDIDPKGGEGILSEAALQSDGSVIAAVETFSPVTGQIIKVVTKSQTQDDFVTLGITGTSVGLVEREHVISLFNVQRTFNRLDPVNGNKFTGPWIPPIDQSHVINEVSRAAGSPTSPSTRLTPALPPPPWCSRPMCPPKPSARLLRCSTTISTSSNRPSSPLIT